MEGADKKSKAEFEKPPIKAVIFDLDGLLIDSEPIWHKAYDVFLKNHKVPNKPEVYKRMIGRGLKENMVIVRDQLGVDGEAEDLLKEIRSVFYSLLDGRDNILLTGVVDLIKKVEGHFKLAVATGGHTKEKCSQILKNVGTFNYFDAVVSSDDVKEGKPAPDVYLETAEQLGVQPLNSFVLEDAVNGVLAAKAAGMRVFGINADEKIRAELEKAGADRVYGSLKEVSI